MKHRLVLQYYTHYSIECSIFLEILEIRGRCTPPFSRGLRPLGAFGPERVGFAHHGAYGPSFQKVVKHRHTDTHTETLVF